MSEENQEVSAETVEPTEQPKQEERVANKFKALYEQDKALKEREAGLKEKEGIVSKFDNWDNLSKREKISILKDDDLYDEYSSVIAEDEETSEQKLEREYRSKIDTLEAERSAEREQFETEQLTQREIDYKKSLSDFVRVDETKEKYGILSELPIDQVENMLYQHVDNFTKEYGHLPEGQDLTDLTEGVEELLVNEVKSWGKIARVRELLLSQENDTPVETSKEPTKTLTNEFEKSEPTQKRNESWKQMQDRKRRESIEKFGM